MRIPRLNGLTLVFQGTKQTSNITSNNIGSINVNAPGHSLGVRANISLPPGKDFYQSLSLGMDYKHYEENLIIAGLQTASPLTYWPLSASYDAN
jgi:hypothetical protein